jgi:replication fork clamp-binding protein CrfC
MKNTIVEHSMYFYTAIYNYVLNKYKIEFDEAKERIVLTKLIQELFDEIKQKLASDQQTLVLTKILKQCACMIKTSHFYQTLKLWEIVLDILDKLRASISNTCV